MAKKKSPAPAPVPAARKRDVHAIRLDVRPGDFERAAACAHRRGLTLASYARMALLDRIAQDEK